jgi:hypothetical protein
MTTKTTPAGVAPDLTETYLVRTARVTVGSDGKRDRVLIADLPREAECVVESAVDGYRPRAMCNCLRQLPGRDPAVWHDHKGFVPAVRSVRRC